MSVATTLHPNHVGWRPCNEPPKTSDNITPFSETIVLYEQTDPITGSKFLELARARWNGIEWRTDDFGETSKPNLFEPEYGCVPLYWALIDLFPTDAYTHDTYSQRFVK